MIRALIPTLLVALVGTALAQAPEATVPPAGTLPPLPTKATLATCQGLDLTPGALTGIAAGPNRLATPIPWSEFEVAGNLVDKPSVVHALLEPTMQQLRTSLSTETLPQVAALTARFGYQLVRYETVDLPKGTKLVLELAPLPLVRAVDLTVNQKLWDKLLEDDVRRRMGIRPGAYLPSEPIHRQCAMLEQSRSIADFLHDEGYFDAEVRAYTALSRSSATVYIDIKLGKEYTLGQITVACPQGYERRKGRCVDPVSNTPHVLAVPEAEIQKAFEHERCLLTKLCIGEARFTREQFQTDLQTVREMFHRAGYPGVRITSSELIESFDRNTQKVNPHLTIDQRRRIDVHFEGQDPDVITDEQLRKQLTFYAAGSADDVEIAESARAIATYVQTRGLFDAHVTWTRERIDVEPRPGTSDVGLHFDKIVFQIDAGGRRRVESVEFKGNHKLSDAQLRELVATKPASLGGTFLGTVASATSVDLINDQERIKEAYRRAGYPDARVGTSASPNPASLDNAAFTAALLGIDEGKGLYVRFTIDEGPPTLVTRVVIQLDGGARPDARLCTDLLGELAHELNERSIARSNAQPTDPTACATTIAGIHYRTEDVAKTREGVRDFLFKQGRARSRVELVAVPIGPQRIELRYTIGDINRLRLGTVVIRGNFRTKRSVIYDQLNFDEGQLLTSDRLADGARRLRTMGLFESVNLDMPDLDCEEGLQCTSETINAVIRVEERYDHTAEVGVEAGYSSYNGPFATLRPILPNIAGRGMRFQIAGTYGTKLQELDARYLFPEYLIDGLISFPFSLELTGLYRIQQTVRFGLLKTQGAGVAMSKVWNRPRIERNGKLIRSAQAFTIGPEYTFRLKSRNVDAVRPIGADMDEDQVAISTRTGQIGARFEFENRVDRAGALSPLAPQDGWRVELLALYAGPAFLGQDKFLKLSGSMSKFMPIGKWAVLRADLRYDQGIPFGGEVLLPEVERFFAGGDSTVRGYADDRMKTEIIEVGVPPIGDLSQIRVNAAGGNIRVLGSLDAQVQIWKIMAGALFTDAGLITNEWGNTQITEIRPSVGMGLRALTPFGIGALEYAIPLRPQLGDDPRGRIHFYFAARAQF